MQNNETRKHGNLILSEILLDLKKSRGNRNFKQIFLSLVPVRKRQITLGYDYLLVHHNRCI